MKKNVDGQDFWFGEGDGVQAAAHFEPEFDLKNEYSVDTDPFVGILTSF